MYSFTWPLEKDFLEVLKFDKILLHLTKEGRITLKFLYILTATKIYDIFITTF